MALGAADASLFSGSDSQLLRLLSKMTLSFQSTPNAIEYDCSTRKVFGELAGTAPGPTFIHAKVYPAGTTPDTNPSPGTAGFKTIPWDPSNFGGDFEIDGDASWPVSGNVTVKVWFDHRQLVSGTAIVNCGSGSGVGIVAELPAGTPAFAIAPRSYVLNPVPPGQQLPHVFEQVLRPGLVLGYDKGRWLAACGPAGLELVVERTNCGKLKGRLTVHGPQQEPFVWRWEGFPWIIDGANVVTRVGADQGGPHQLILQAE